MGAGRTRVAILGGGVGALTAAFALTETDPAGALYDITIHQLGWRLGGKIASGRNAAYGQRIEEHGLHIWAGFYENAFTVMRCVLKALNPPEGQPRRTLSDAFVRQNMAIFADQQGDDWSPWPFFFDPDADPTVFPGRDDLFAPVTGMLSLEQALRRIVAFLSYSHRYYGPHWDQDPDAQTAQVIAGMTPPARAAVTLIPAQPRANDAHPILGLAGGLMAQLESQFGEARTHAEAALSALLHGYRGLAEAAFLAAPRTQELRRIFILNDIYARCGLGILRHNCLVDGLAVIDKYDFREFLTGTLPLDEAVQGAIVTGGYEYLFSYQGGNRATPRLSACTALQGFLRLISYRGAFFFKATAGMGDTVAGPLYQVLKQRGVKFRFFQRVTKLHPSADGTQIGAIDIDRQASLHDGLAEYQPLVGVNGLDCWPSAPDWAQLQNGPALEAADVNFENLYSPQPAPVARTQLRLGEDFDRVVLGISLGALQDICEPLIHDRAVPARAQAWSDMVTKIGTARTQALQLWMTCDVAALGGPFMATDTAPVVLQRAAPSHDTGPIVTAGKPPFDTYADMSHLLPAEAWGAHAPASVGYFCAVLDDAAAPDDQAAANAAVKANASTWMTSWLGVLWTSIGSGAAFRWDLLYSPGGFAGAARLQDQYWRANINPSDRYVLALPGTLDYRLDPGGSGYSNLYLAGDWTRVPDINAGCVEVAAMSGLKAAAALSGRDIPVASFDTLFGRNRARYMAASHA